MNLSNTLKLLSLLLLFTIGMTSCEDDDDPDVQQNIAATASANADFSILVDALTKTDLVGALSGASEFTVFAPTNAAFGRALSDLGFADLDALEAGVGNEGLKRILLYHVLGGEVKAADVQTGFASGIAPRTAGGTDYLTMFIESDGGVVKINNKATVRQADIDCTNGVIHAIDEVILPLDIVDLAILSPVHTALVGALGTADGDLVNALRADGPFTVFAPVDAGFGAIQSTVDGLDATQLSTVLTYHVLTAGNVRSDAVPAGPISTLSGQMVTLGNTGGVTITDQADGISTVQIADLQGTNGVIHAVNNVLIPAL